eukprot:c18437_g1_i1 orf=451-966(-)
MGSLVRCIRCVGTVLGSKVCARRGWRRRPKVSRTDGYGRPYERVSSVDDIASPNSPKTIRLGARLKVRTTRIRILRLLRCTPVNLALVSKLRGTYERVMEMARQSNIHVTDLFAGNQLVMHLFASPICRHHSRLQPSSGFWKCSIVQQSAGLDSKGNSDKFKIVVKDSRSN